MLEIIMRKTLLLSFIVSLGACASALSPPYTPCIASAGTSSPEKEMNAMYRQLNLFGDVLEKVRNEYVDRPEDSKLIESSIKGMLNNLDPHSSYMDAKTFKDMQSQTKGEFGGLGIEVTLEDGFLKIITPIDDTPAARAGLMPNDMITQINGESVLGMSFGQAVDAMRGPVNTTVTITVHRPGKKNAFDVTLKRAIVQIQSVKSQVMDDVGYIRITQFNDQTFDKLSAAFEQFKKEKPHEDRPLKGYILDLRNNPGGLLEQAILVTNAFISQGEIVSTRGRTKEDIQRYSAKPPSLAGEKPVIVLINGGSASASEIVAGALQDHKRAKILGSRSFGKGSVQTVIPLDNNGALRLTTARYFTPSGHSIQAKGITPDIEVKQDVPSDLAGKDQIQGEASLRGHLKNGDGEKSGSSAYVPLDQSKDVQLRAALNLLNSRPIDAKMDPLIKDRLVEMDPIPSAQPPIKKDDQSQKNAIKKQKASSPSPSKKGEKKAP
jgi:carboxyl-terminal processing protease